MSKLEKLIKRILDGQAISYGEAEALLKRMGFSLLIRGSHHIFRKPGYYRHVSLKRRQELLPYQIRNLIEVLKDHGY